MLTDERRHWILRGAAFVKLVPLLDGSRDVVEVAAQEPSFSLIEVAGAISRLKEIGALAADGDTDGDLSRTAFWDALGAEAGGATGRLRAAAVEPIGVGGASVDALIDALEVSGIGVGKEGIACVIAADHLDPELARLNREFLERGREWVLARLVGTRFWLGPHFAPPQTGCWACMAFRLEANRAIERQLRTSGADELVSPAAPAWLDVTARAGTSLLASVLATTLAGAPAPLRGMMAVLDLVSLESERHTLIRRPHCPECGDPRLSARRGPIELEPAASEAAGLGDRTVDSAELIERLRAHVDPFLGTIRGVVRVAPPDSPLHAYASGTNQAMTQGSLEVVTNGLRAENGGKGQTTVDAEAGAICEALERWCGQRQGAEPVAGRGTLAERGEVAISPERLLLFSERQYAQRDADALGGHNMVFERFDPSEPIDWTPAWSLTQSRERELPAAYCWYGWPLDGAAFCRADSNGCAAGSTLTEAALQGLLELVERDAVALWWYSRACRPGVDLTGFESAFLDAAREWLARNGRELWVLDLTTDLGIPAFAAVSVLSVRGGKPILGFGAHTDPLVAVTRAICELGQFLPLLERVGTSRDPELSRWLDGATVGSEPWIAADPESPLRTTAELHNLRSGELRADLEGCLARVERAGLEAILVDQSRPDVELAVVKMIVPGLRHFWRRLAPGRLYDVPVELGWVDRRLDEAELNPWGVFF